MDDILESVIGFDALYESMNKCKRNVGWKDSVAQYYLNGVEETLKLEEELKSGTYKAMPTKKIHITHPKPRDAVSIAFRDRVYQRSLNDVVIYPCMTKPFINANAACQQGKGPAYARDLLDRYLHEYYRKHGTDGFVLQGDIKGYYPNMNHAAVEASFKKSLPPQIYSRAEVILRTQYEGDIGYNPGSQLVQIAGISLLSPLDHFIKEKLRIKYYFRYMDDFVLIHESEEYLEWCKERIKEFLSASVKCELHPKKTRIYSLRDGIKVLGFTHKLTDSGKVIRLIDPKNVKAERKRLYRMVQLAKQGKTSKWKVNECYRAWKAHAANGNTFKVVQRMDEYYKNLWKDDSNGNTQKIENVNKGAETG